MPTMIARRDFRSSDDLADDEAANAALKAA
jgi:hypothetical protein